jgi:hypothetical protein
MITKYSAWPLGFAAAKAYSPNYARGFSIAWRIYVSAYQKRKRQVISIQDENEQNA